MAEPRRKAASAPLPAGAAVRAAAARAVKGVRTDGSSLTQALERLQVTWDERDRSLLLELSFGSMRILPRLEAIAGLLLRKPLKPQDADLEALILVGLYQLDATRVPPHAAVGATVGAARVLGKGWASGLINALLRRFLRERGPLLARASRSPGARWLFPTWLLDRLKGAWPDRWQELVAASNGQAPLCLRVNRRLVSRSDYAVRLATAGIRCQEAAHAPDGLVLHTPVPVSRLPGFSEGLVSVQDAGAQLAAPLLEARPGDRVLDACCAPGGKTTHILEIAEGELDLTALDLDAQRLIRVRENLGRLGLSARVLCADAAAPTGDWAEQPFDRILLDVPCSATGVIRRHPDIKWLRRDQDIAALASRQAAMLDALWTLLAPGGCLLYVTCSLLPEENHLQIALFLDRQRDAREIPIDAPWGRGTHPGRQILTGEDGMDGFYFARLGKVVR